MESMTEALDGNPKMMQKLMERAKDDKKFKTFTKYECPVIGAVMGYERFITGRVWFEK